MTTIEAEQIRDFKKTCTYRRLAEIYYGKSHDLAGNQLAGQELCEEAFAVLYPYIQLRDIVWGENPVFDEQNQSSLGNFYWWE